VPVASLALGALFSVTRERVYEAEAEVLILTDSSRSLFSASPAMAERFGRNPASELQFLSSEEFRESVAPMDQRYDVDYELVKTEAGQDVVDSDLLAFTARGPDAAKAADIATRYAEAYISKRQNHDVGANTRSRDQASARLVALGEELRGAQDKIVGLREQLGDPNDAQQSAALASAEQEFRARRSSPVQWR
jgi:uncharacterized protein involved in exopolysaccharide biosynthesis